MSHNHPNRSPLPRQLRARRSLGLAVSVASAGLLSASCAFADGTATAVLTADRTWNTTGTWTWVGDTGNQVYPGDGIPPGAGTEAAVTQALYGNRTLNIGSNAAGLGGFTIGSFTYQQAQAGVGRQLTVNYQGTTNQAKFNLNTSIINHVD